MNGVPLPKWLLAFIVLLVLGVIGVNMVFFTVREDQQVVVTRLGKPVRVIRAAGLSYRVPFVEQLTYFDRRLLEYDSNPTEIITQDKKTLVVDNFSRWRIIDPLQFLRTVRDEVGAQARLDDIIYSELRLELGRKDLIEIVAKERGPLMEKVTQEADRKAKEYGIQIVDVRLKRGDLPAENLKAIYGRMQAERERIATQYRSEGREEAQKIRAGTDRERDILLADAYEKEQKIMGEGDARSIDITARAFAQDAEFYTFLKSLEVYQKSFKDKTTILLPSDSNLLRFLQQEGIRGAATNKGK
ncbi:MAG: protease modulator HflC [Candidatus Tectomicrobia bacterium]|nr:protease modulator HflC [Candidatus Tectomicrobia bacterium]